MTNNNSSPYQRLNDEDMMGEPFERIGLLGWLGLYATGAILLFFLLAHIWLVHYTSSQPVTLRSTLLALRSPFVRTINLGLLVFSVVHGMIGLRRIILDLELLKKRGVQYLTWCLVAMGFILFAGGLYIFNLLSSGIKGM